MSRLSLHGNTLSVKLDSFAEVLKFLAENTFKQVTIVEDAGKYIVSRPLPEDERGAYAHLYRKQGNKPKPPTPPKGGGPSGGSPAGGRQAKFVVTEAVAA